MKVKGFLYVILFCFVTHLSSTIHEVYDLDLFTEETEKLTSDDLIIYDIDNTLIAPEDLIMRASCRKLRSKLLQEFKVKPDYQEYIFSLIYERYKVNLVDPQIVDLIISQQRRGIPAIALTGSMTAKFGVLESIEKWRYNQIGRLGIDFSPSFNLSEDPYYFSRFAIMMRYPSFYKGILFTDLVPKGAVLIAFLNKLDWKPRKVVFIDDRADYLKSVRSSLEAIGVEFIGFHYRAAEESIYEEEAEKLGRFQYESLIERRQWVPDRQARKELGLD